MRGALSWVVLVAACASRAPAAPVAPARWPAPVDASATNDAGASSDVATSSPLTQVTRIVLDADGQCALRADGSAWCWHGTAHLRLPAGPLTPPEEYPDGAWAVPGLHDLDALCLSVEASCGRRRDGAVTCRTIRAGDGESPAPESEEFRVDVLEAVVPGDPAERLEEVGGACVITLRDGRREQVVPPRNRRDGWSRMTFSGPTDRCSLHEGAARCEGSNRGALLANSDAASFSATAPSLLFGLRNLREVQLGERHACAVTLDGAVLCWGQNHDGQLGTGDARGRALPTRVPGIEGVRAVRVGRTFTCALREAGDIWCWGAPRIRLFDEPRPRPTPLREAGGFSAIEVDGLTLCGLREAGTVWCWDALHPSEDPRAGAPRRVDLAR